MKRINRVVGALAVSAALIATGCGGGGGDEGDGPVQDATTAMVDYNQQPYEKIKEGGSVTTAITEINAQMNVWHADMTKYTRELWIWYNPQPLLYTAEGDVEADPDYFTEISDEVVDGKTQVTYTINEKAVFNDGTPIDWRALEAGWKACNGEDGPTRATPPTAMTRSKASRPARTTKKRS